MKSIKDRVQEFEQRIKFTNFKLTTLDEEKVFKIINNDFSTINFFVSEDSVKLFKQLGYDKILKTFYKIPMLRKIMEDNKVILNIDPEGEILSAYLNDDTATIITSANSSNNLKSTTSELLLALCKIATENSYRNEIRNLPTEIVSKLGIYSEFNLDKRGAVAHESYAKKLYNSIIENDRVLLTKLLSEKSIVSIDQVDIQDHFLDQSISLALGNKKASAAIDSLFKKHGEATYTKYIYPFLLEYLASKGYDTSNCYIVPEGRVYDPVHNLIQNVNPNKPLCILYSSTGEHWHFKCFIKNKSNELFCINSETLGPKVFDVVGQTDWVYKNVKETYFNDHTIQNGQYGCVIFSLKFLKYILSHDQDYLLSQIKSLTTGEISSHGMQYYQYPVEVLKLAQSMQYIQERNGLLKDKIKISGKKLSEEISLVDYVNTDRNKYHVSTPDYSTGKLRNNLLDYFYSKYYIEAKKIANAMSIKEITNLIAEHHLDDNMLSSNPCQEGQVCLGDMVSFES